VGRPSGRLRGTDRLDPLGEGYGGGLEGSGVRGGKREVDSPPGEIMGDRPPESALLRAGEGVGAGERGRGSAVWEITGDRPSRSAW